MSSFISPWAVDGSRSSEHGSTLRQSLTVGLDRVLGQSRKDFMHRGVVIR